MPNHEDERLGRGLSPKKQRILLWMPLIGIWLVLYLIAEKPEDGGRDWPTLIMMLVVSGLVYAGVWFALVRTTCSKDARGPAEERQTDAPRSRAALIYGESKSEEDDQCSGEQ